MHQEKKVRDAERKSDMIRKDLTRLQSLDDDGETDAMPPLQKKMTLMEQAVSEIRQNLKKESEHGMTLMSKNVQMEDKIRQLTEKVSGQERELRAKIDNQAVTINYMIDSISGLQTSINKIQGGDGDISAIVQDPRFLNGGHEPGLDLLRTSQDVLIVQ